MSLRLASDSASLDLAGQVGELLCERTGVVDLDDAALAGSAGSWLLLFDLAASERALQAQLRLLDAGARVLMLGLEPGALWLGARITAGTRGCLGCLRLRVANNLRQQPHWSAGLNGQRRRASAQRPLSPPQRLWLRALLSAALDEGSAAHRAHEGFAQSVLRLDLDAGSSRLHRFVAHSDCPYCAPLPADAPALADWIRERRLRRDASRDRLDNPHLTLPRARRHFVDRRTGLIRHLYRDLGSALMPMAVSELPIPGSETIERGYGRAESRERSELVALLEALERHAGHAPRGRRVVERGSLNSLRERHGAQVIDPREFVLHAPEQQAEPGYRLTSYTDDLEFDWCWGHSVRQGRPVLVPLQLVHYWLDAQPGRPVNRFVFDTSNGCALGGSPAEAALYGLSEVIERDAYFCTWYGRWAPPRIDADSIDDVRVQALLARSRAEGYEVQLFDLRAGIAWPTVMAMIVDPADQAPVKSYCASAAHRRWGQAAFAALVEVTTSMGVYRRSLPALRERARRLHADDAQVQEMPDHVLLYSLPESFARLEFLQGGPRRSLAECRAQLRDSVERDPAVEFEALCQRVLAYASDVIVVDQGFEALREGLGLHCVKVLAPGLLPVSFGHQYRRIRRERIDAAAGALGIDAAALAARGLNPYPHNFP